MRWQLLTTPSAWPVSGVAALLTMLPSMALAQNAPSSYTTGYRYDSMHRLTGTISPDPDGSGPRAYRAVRNTYDSAGRLVRVEKGELSQWQSEAIAPANWPGFAITEISETVYDGFDRKLQEKQIDPADGSIQELIQTSYDDVGRVDCVATRMNSQTYSSLPVSACTLTTTGPFGPDRITHNVYDASGQLLTVQKGYRTSIQGNYAAYTYSPNGKQKSVTDADGNVATMSYDGFDRLARWNMPSPKTPGQTSSTDYETYTYDANGNRLSVRRRDGRTLTFAYDGLNRVLSKLVPDGCAPIQVGACTPATATRDVYYSYDVRGHQLAARFDSASGADAVTSSYDGFGRLVSSTISMGGFTKTLGAQYDADGDRTRLTHPDGVYFTTGFDGLDRVSSGSWTTSSGTTPFLTITYDSAARRSDVNRGSSYTGYGYDRISRLTSMNQRFAGGLGNVNLGFAYNPASQITSETRDVNAFAFTGLVSVNRNYTVNGLDQYTAAGPVTFAYDANGNLASDGTYNFTYDAENRLVAATVPNGFTTTLTYDPLGRLWRVAKADAAGSAISDTRFLYDHDDLAAEYDSSGSITRRFMFAGPDEPILEDAGGALNCSGTRFLHIDHQGSVIAQADCNGNRTSINSYDEYGIPGPDNTGRFQYTGQAWIPELGMYYYKARMYSPTLGRFMQTDPIGYKDEINLYEYVRDDPIDGTDPAGTCGKNGIEIAGCTVFADDRGRIPPAMKELSPQSMSDVNGHAIFGDGSPRAVDFSKVDLSDLGISLQRVAAEDGQLHSAIAKALSSGEPQEVHLKGVRAGGGFEGDTSAEQKVAIGRFSVEVDGTVRPNGDGSWYLDGRVRGEPDEQDYPDDPRRTGVGPAGNSLGAHLQRLFGGRNYWIYFYGSQRLIIWGWPN